MSDLTIAETTHASQDSFSRSELLRVNLYKLGLKLSTYGSSLLYIAPNQAAAWFKGEKRKYQQHSLQQFMNQQHMFLSPDKGNMLKHSDLF